MVFAVVSQTFERFLLMLSGSKTMLSQFDNFQFFTDEGQVNRVSSIK